MKLHRVRLTRDERQTLEGLVTKGRAAARKLTRARILLKADEGPPDEENRKDRGAKRAEQTERAGSGWTDEAIGDALDVSSGTVEWVRKRAVFEGPLAPIEHRPSTAPPCTMTVRSALLSEERQVHNQLYRLSTTLASCTAFVVASIRLTCPRQ